jgi:hypothetical protein
MQADRIHPTPAGIGVVVRRVTPMVTTVLGG